MRKHALYASAVVASEEFLSMDTASQALYFQLLCEAETDGELVNVNRIVRATGLGQEALAGLFERDYLIEVGGRVFIRHNWQNNKLNAKVWKSMDSCEPYLNGQLEFEGIEGKTPYRIVHTEVSPSSHPSDTQAVPSNGTGSGMDTCNGTCTYMDTSTSNGYGEGTLRGEGAFSPTITSSCHQQKTFTRVCVTDAAAGPRTTGRQTVRPTRRAPIAGPTNTPDRKDQDYE